MPKNYSTGTQKVKSSLVKLFFVSKFYPTPLRTNLDGHRFLSVSRFFGLQAACRSFEPLNKKIIHSLKSADNGPNYYSYS